MKKIDLYVHIPFCNNKCKYCYFYSVKNPSFSIMKSYLSLLKKEAELKIRQFGEVDVPESVYIGGGSPNFLPAILLNSLFSFLSDKFEIGRSKEINVEMNPSFCSENQLKILNRFGVSRVSFGVQTTDSAIAESIGRKNDIKKVRKTIEYAKKLGMLVNLDFMLNLPGQNLNNILSDIKFVEETGPDSVYFYECKYVTPYMKLKSKIALAPHEFNKRFAVLSDKLKELGYRHNLTEFFSRNYFTSLYNRNWIAKNNLFGLGPFSMSRFGRVWHKSYPDISRYFSLLKKNKLPTWFTYKMTPTEFAILYFTYEIRFGKVNFEETKRLFGEDINTLLGKELEFLRDKGYILLDAENVSLTEKGIVKTFYVQDILGRKLKDFEKVFQLLLGRP